jgi:hypothetical protein
VLGQIAVDRGLEIDERMEGAALSRSARASFIAVDAKAETDVVKSTSRSPVTSLIVGVSGKSGERAAPDVMIGTSELLVIMLIGLMSKVVTTAASTR